MRKAAGYMVYRVLLCLLLLLVATGIQAQDSEWLNRKIQIKETKGTRYQLLRHISDQTGYLFVYDSPTLDNDAKVQMRKGEYTLRDAIYAITGNRGLQISLIGNSHIVLRLPEQVGVKSPVAVPVVENTYFTISGTVYDLFSKEPLASATVNVVDLSIGTVTNGNGRFRITLPDSLSHLSIRISYVGYETLEIPVANRMNLQSDFMLEPQVVPLQEVVVRVANPRLILEQMIKNRPLNYSHEPVYLTAFYREGVEHKKRNVDLTEAVLKVYQPDYKQFNGVDQVKLIKMRRIIDKQERDTILTKVKSGIHSALLLDVIKNDPDFLDIYNPQNPYTYAHTDIAVVNDRLANVISFEQKKGTKEPLYRGDLFIDMDNSALLEARFQINPAHVERATNMFIEKRSKMFKLTLRDAKYTVSYKPLGDGTYYISHVRGDLEFRVRRKRQWFSSTLKVWFELVNCRVDTENVQPIPRAERISPRTVFSETKHPYDIDFWSGFNVILPEDELKELILNNLTEVMESP